MIDSADTAIKASSSVNQVSKLRKQSLCTVYAGCNGGDEMIIAPQKGLRLRVFISEEYGWIFTQKSDVVVVMLCEELWRKNRCRQRYIKQISQIYYLHSQHDGDLRLVISSSVHICDSYNLDRIESMFPVFSSRLLLFNMSQCAACAYCAYCLASRARGATAASGSASEPLHYVFSATATYRFLKLNINL